MNLSCFVGEPGAAHRDIVFMENKNTKYKIVVKRAEMEKGINEIQAYKSMDHSSLIDFSIDKEGVVMMLHRHSGESLEEKLDRKKDLRDLSENIEKVLNSSLTELRKLHNCGICHGSISPRKIIIDEDYSVRFVGYGNSSKIVECRVPLSYSVYTAPEIILGGTVNPELADVYSLGRSLAEIVKGGHCLDMESVGRISDMSSVIPKRREIFLNASKSER